MDDRCGGTLFCGTCGAGQVCGAGGANVCGAPPASCAPATCASMGASCGSLPDGCGGTLSCGSCPAGQACGGGGTANACGAPPVKGGETVSVTWIGGADAEEVTRVRSDAAGNLYVAGTIVGDGGKRSLFVGKRRPDGAVIWEKRLEVPTSTFLDLSGLAVSPGGSVLCVIRAYCSASPCGVDLGGGLLQFGLVKLDASGAFEWQRAFQPASGDVAAGPDGAIAVSAEWGADHGFDVLDAKGASLWKGAATNAHAFSFAPDGSLLVAWNDVKAQWKPMLSRFDATGKELWRRATTDWVRMAATSGRGTPVVVEGGALAVYEAADGAQRFRTTLPMWVRDLAVRPGVHDVVEAVAVGQDAAGCSEMEARAYDLAGQFRWVRLVGPSAGCAGAPSARGVTVLDDGTVVVGGAATVSADLGKGEHAPQGASDGFLLELAP